MDSWHLGMLLLTGMTGIITAAITLESVDKYGDRTFRAKGIWIYLLVVLSTFTVMWLAATMSKLG